MLTLFLVLIIMAVVVTVMYFVQEFLDGMFGGRSSFAGMATTGSLLGTTFRDLTQPLKSELPSRCCGRCAYWTGDREITQTRKVKAVWEQYATCVGTHHNYKYKATDLECDMYTPVSEG